MFNLILYAVPYFVALLAIEWISFHHTGDHDEAMAGYDVRDTATSLSMGLGNLVINLGWKLVVLVIYTAVYELTPLRVPSDAWWAWVLLFFADDLAYYWFHRVSHEVRVFWASHVVHHSSQHYNLSTALRQTWVPMTYLPFWLPLALIGIPPWMIILEQSISLVYQFGIHTERVGRLWRPLEFVFNTPSHHRVHHGANEQYLDRNYGGILIVWDRLFGSFPGRDRAGPLRADEEHRDPPSGPRRVSRVHRDRPRSAVRARAGASGSATCSAARAGRRLRRRPAARPDGDGAVATSR